MRQRKLMHVRSKSLGLKRMSSQEGCLMTERRPAMTERRPATCSRDPARYKARSRLLAAGRWQSFLLLFFFLRDGIIRWEKGSHS